MDIRFYQICFTNDNGWSALNCSEGTPARAVKAFETIQNRYIGVGDSLSRESVTNYYTAEGFFFIAKMIYGYGDRFGRSCHFAQAFCFHLDEIMQNPDYITEISDDNFTIKRSENMDQSIESTKTPPDNIILQEAKSLEIDDETQKIFSYSVYRALTSIRNLGIICDGQTSSAKGIFAFMMKILPQTLSGQLSLTAFKKPLEEKFVLCTLDNTVKRVINLLNGECSIFDDGDLEEFSKYPFTNCYKFTDSDKDYLNKIDQCLSQLDFGDTLKIDYLKIADFFVSIEPDESSKTEKLDEKSFNELSDYLDLILSAGFKRTEYSDLKMSQFISYLLEKYFNDIDELTYEKIIEYSDKSELESLNEIKISCIIRIIINRYGSVSAEDQKKYLRRLSLSQNSFDRIKEELQKEEAGKDIIDLYYLDELESLSDNKEEILKFADSVSDVSLYPKTVRNFGEKIARLYCCRFSPQDENVNENLRKDLNEISEALTKPDFTDCCFEAIKKLYWDSFDPEAFNWDNLKLAESAEYSGDIYKAFLSILKNVEAIRNYSEEDRERIIGFLDDISNTRKKEECVNIFGKSNLEYIISVIIAEFSKSQSFKSKATVLEVKRVAFLKANPDESVEYIVSSGFGCISDSLTDKDPIFKSNNEDDLDSLIEVLDQYNGDRKKEVNALKSILKSVHKAKLKEQKKKDKSNFPFFAKKKK